MQQVKRNNQVSFLIITQRLSLVVKVVDGGRRQVEQFADAVKCGAIVVAWIRKRLSFSVLFVNVKANVRNQRFA